MGCPIIDRVFLRAASITSALLCALRLYEGLPEPSARNLPAKSEYQKRAGLQGGVSLQRDAARSGTQQCLARDPAAVSDRAANTLQSRSPMP